MIFVPKIEKCIVWNETEDGIYILYFVDGNDTREFPISFLWSKTPKECKNEKDIIYVMDYDPFYLHVESCMREEVLNCSLNACSAKPQLRYNKIINKWFCNCPSSAICTKDDQDELKELLSITKKIDYNHGFCNNPIEAILKWNENCAKNYFEIAKNNLNIAKLNRKKLKMKEYK